MKLIVGLGNPGTKYQKTRHNIGFMVIEQFLKDFETVAKTVWENSAKFKSDIAEIEWQRRSSRSSSGQAKELVEKVILVKPKTFMNNSGMAVALINSFYKIKPEDIWIIHDDIDLPLGGMKIRFGGGDGGHRGITSLREAIGDDKFWRFRLGIGHPRKMANGKWQMANRKDVEDFVLGKFAGGEWGKARELIKRGAKAIEMALEDGLEAAMNRFNSK